MANAHDVRKKFASMSAEQLEATRQKMGWEKLDAEGVITHLIQYPQHDGKISFAFGLSTEADKVAQATPAAAWYAKLAFVATVLFGIAGIIVALVVANQPLAP